MRGFLIFLLVLITGCSSLGKSSHYELVTNQDLVRTYIYDWYEKETSVPSLGVFRPPVYSKKYGAGYFILYPVLIKDHPAYIGPPVLPFIPVSVFGEKNRETHVLEIRQYNQPIKPINAVITGKTGYTKKCQFVLESSDKLGNVYACKLDKHLYGEKYLTTIIELSDKEKFEVEYQIRHDTFYSPLFSFNGPEPKIEVVFEHSR